MIRVNTVVAGLYLHFPAQYGNIFLRPYTIRCGLNLHVHSTVDHQGGIPLHGDSVAGIPVHCKYTISGNTHL